MRWYSIDNTKLCLQGLEHRSVTIEGIQACTIRIQPPRRLIVLLQVYVSVQIAPHIIPDSLGQVQICKCFSAGPEHDCLLCKSSVHPALHSQLSLFRFHSRDFIEYVIYHLALLLE